MRARIVHSLLALNAASTNVTCQPAAAKPDSQTCHTRQLEMVTWAVRPQHNVDNLTVIVNNNYTLKVINYIH